MEKMEARSPLVFLEQDKIISEKIGSTKRKRHVVLFYEEPEYAAMLCFKYIMAGLDGGRCGYVSQQERDLIRSEMMAGGMEDFDQLLREGLLKVLQFPDLLDYPGGSKKGLEAIALALKNDPRQIILDRTVLKCMHRVKLRREIEANMDLERRHHINFKMFSQSSLLVTYPVSDMLSVAKGERGVYSEWMELLVKKYDSVIFAYSVQEGGIALNLL